MAIQVAKEEVAKQKIKHARLAIDLSYIDVLLSEKSGGHIDGLEWFWDNSQHKSILVHNIISSHYVAGTFHVPLDSDIYIKRKDCRDKRILFVVATIAFWSPLLCLIHHRMHEASRHG